MADSLTWGTLILSVHHEVCRPQNFKEQTCNYFLEKAHSLRNETQGWPRKSWVWLMLGKPHAKWIDDQWKASIRVMAPAIDRRGFINWKAQRRKGSSKHWVQRKMECPERLTDWMQNWWAGSGSAGCVLVCRLAFAYELLQVPGSLGRTVHYKSRKSKTKCDSWHVLQRCLQSLLGSRCD